MEVILLENVDNLGDMNDVVTVKNGYGRNFLIPTKKAIIANDVNKKNLEEKLKQQSVKLKAILDEAKANASKVEGASIKIGAKVGKDEKIFGSITTIQLADAVKAATGLEIDRRKVTIAGGDIKAVGSYEGTVQLHKEVKVAINFDVVAE